MKIKYFFLAVILFLFLMPLVYASCAITLDKSDYIAGETATLAMSCSENGEKNEPYNVNWTNSSGYQYELDYGTTPPVAGQTFYQSFIIPTTWPNGIWLNVSINGTGLTPANNDSANVTATGSTGSLLITNASFGGGYIGKVASVQAIVKDETGKKISGGFCRISAWSNDETQMLLDQNTVMVNGEVKVSDIMPPTRFDEGVDYAYKITCYCGSDTSMTECIDEDGTAVADSIGFTKGFFTMSTWLEVNTLTDADEYNPKQEVFICVNVTNVDYSSRIPMHIYHQIRCSGGLDYNNDTDRALIASDGELPDERGISINTTQMQCKRFVIPDAKYLQGKTSECYASTTTWVLNDKREKLISYATTSPVFNVTLNNLQLYANWEKIEDYKWNTIIDLSKRAYQEYSGIGTGYVKIHLAHPSLFTINPPEQYGGNEMPFDNLLSAEQIKNITATNSTGGNVTTSLHYKKQGQLDLYLESVDISSTGWYNVTINLNSFEERQTEALEGINTKTGTFHLDVDCPSESRIYNDITCTITAYIEDQQLVTKEVDFTCYITRDGKQFSSLNFNHMVTRTLQTIEKDFYVPSDFGNEELILQCHADYYNFGSRRDSFYDTFWALYTSDKKPSITGDAIGEGIIPFVPKEKEWIVLIITLIIAITLLILIKILKKKEICFPTHKTKKSALKIILTAIAIISTLIAASIGIYYLCIVLSSTIQPVQQAVETQTTSVSIFQDKLIRGIILTAFIVLMIILLFKSLHIRGEVKFGEDHYVKKYKHDSKLSRIQKKINRHTLKDELKRNKRTKHPPKIKKVKIKRKR